MDFQLKQYRIRQRITLPPTPSGLPPLSTDIEQLLWANDQAAAELLSRHRMSRVVREEAIPIHFEILSVEEVS